MLQGLLNAEGHDVGRLHVRTLMRKMGIKAIYRRPNTSKPAPGHKVYPYLLKNLAIPRTKAAAKATTDHFIARSKPMPACTSSSSAKYQLLLCCQQAFHRFLRQIVGGQTR